MKLPFNRHTLLPGLKGYGRADWRADLQAGLTVSVLLVPQAMAYALLAGFPPVYGLYASVVPLLIYALLGSSPHLSVGPTALVSLLVISGLRPLAPPGSELYIQLAISTALLAGLMQLLLGMVRLGVLVNFLSRPVISGFTSAAAVIIALSQIPALLGVESGRSSRIYLSLSNIFNSLDEIHWLTLALGAFSLLMLYGMRRWRPKFPAALVLVGLATGATALFSWHELGLAVVGEAPRGLPGFDIPQFDSSTLNIIWPAALTIALISFVESLAIGKSIAAQHRYYRIDPNQELVALGLSKTVGAFFQAFPTTGSFGRSAVNDAAGARTGIASLIAGLITILVLLFLTPVFYFLPQATLAAVIILAVIKLFDLATMRELWQQNRKDFATLAATFAITLFFGIQQGIIAGILLSLAFVIFRNARPHIAVLGQLGESSHFRNVNRFADARQEEEVLIIRFDSELYFGNADYFRQTIEQLVRRKGPRLQIIILDASSMHDLDSTGTYVFRELLEDLQEKGIELYLAGVIGPVRDILYRTGLMQLIGPDQQFLDIADALQYFRRQQNDGLRDWSVPAVQTNFRPNRDDT